MKNFDSRGLNDIKDEARRSGASTPEQYAEAGFVEVHQAFDRMMLNEARSDSESRLMEDDVVKALDNYAKVDPEFNLKYSVRQFSRGFRYTGRRQMLERAESKIQEAQKKFPDAGLKTWSELMAVTQDKTADDRNTAMQNFANARGMARAGMLTGSATGIVTDPLILATLPIGAGTITGGSILSNAARAFRLEAIIAGASESLIQPQVYNWKKDINSPYSVGEAAFNVVTAMVAAGTLRASGSVMMDVVEIRGAAKLKRAEGSKLSDQEADILEQYADDIEAGGQAKQEHFDNLDQAIDDLDRGQTSSAARSPEHVEEVDPLTIGVDAEQFQFKAGTDVEGVSERLQGVERWDPKMAGIAIVYENKAGSRFIVDGHQRVGLAKRMIAQGQDPGEVKLNAIVVREADGVSVADARQIAAVKNIAEGTGSAVDTAKVFRELGESGLDLMPSLPPKSALVMAGRGLSNLDDDAFSMVINGVVDEKVGAIVGELVTDAAEQRAIITALAKSEPANLVQARIMINDMKAAGFQRVETEDLFGGQEIAETLFQERAKILDNSIKRLRQDKKTFKTLQEKAGAITSEGNVLNEQANLARISSDEQTLTELTRLANTKGQISDALNQASRDLKEGKTVKQATEDFLDAVRRGDTGERVEGPGAGGAGQADETGNLIAEIGQPVRLQELAEEDVLPAEVAFRESQMDKSLDDIYKVASTRQGQLTRTGRAIVKDIGDDKIIYVFPGVKKRAKAEQRLIDKGKQPGEMTDIVRGGFAARDVEETDRIVDMLAAKYKIIDEGIVAVDMGYVDRKVLVQFDDGIIAEIQIWEPHMLAAKEGDAIHNILPEEWIDPNQVLPPKGKTGHDYYDKTMELVENRKVPPENRAAFDALIKEAQEEVYIPAIRLANLSWKELIDIRLPEFNISGGAAAAQVPGSAPVGIKKPAIEPSASSTTTAGRVSQSNQPVTSESKKGVSMSESIADSETGVKAGTILDDNGDPLTVYHGTSKEFDEFRDEAQFFTPDEEIAGRYAEAQGGERIVEANIAIEKPLVIDADGDSWDVINIGGFDVDQKTLNKIFPTLRSEYDMYEVLDSVKLNASDDFDGIIVKNVSDAPIGEPKEIDVYITFSNRQISKPQAKPKETDEVLDLFGEDTRGAQAMHDARLAVDKELNPDNVVPVEAGPGDLFSGKSRQVELEDEVDRLVYERDLEIPEKMVVDDDGNITSVSRGAKEVYDEIDNSAKAVDEIEGCYLGQA